MNINKITIIGLGLIGGSILKAFHNHGIGTVLYGIDQNVDSIRSALEMKLLTEGDTHISERVFDSDVIILCAPVKTCISILKALEGKIRKDCIVTDVCSTKMDIINTIERLHNPPIFIGGHPMAGKEHSGFLNSDADIFNNAKYIITPSKTTTKEAQETLLSIIQKIGSKPVLLEATLHDTLLSNISHMPQIIASALVHLLLRTDSEEYQELLGGGFVDTTRIASSNPSMWEHILLTNKENIVKQLELFQVILEELKQSINTEDANQLNYFFSSAKAYRDHLILKRNQ